MFFELEQEVDSDVALKNKEPNNKQTRCKTGGSGATTTKNHRKVKHNKIVSFFSSRSLLFCLPTNFALYFSRLKMMETAPG
jgi:hypothetical protein